MSINFVAATDFQPVAPAPETFALLSADQTYPSGGGRLVSKCHDVDAVRLNRPYEHG
jgi:hypothetical protein